jgi:hypothetical protein
VDFVYTCQTHLSDKGFATKVDPAQRSVSSEDIDEVKREWEQKQAAKGEKETKKEKESGKDKEEDKDKDKGKSEGKGEDSKEMKKKTAPSTSTIKQSPTPPSSTHEKYILHRDIFSLRQGEHRKARQAKAAKELAPRLPGAPTGDVS